MSQRGFSLLEVLIAFSILALSLGILMRIFSGALNNTATAVEQTEALTLAQSLLAGAGVETPFTEGEMVGRQGDRLEWQLTMRRFESAQDTPSTTLRVTAPAVHLWEISVRVAWGGTPSSRARVVTLTTLRAGREDVP